MRPEHTIERHGKTYVLYVGLLDMAHERGLKSIETGLVQVPTGENGNVAICKAVVEMADGGTYAGIGDASPGNVGRTIVPHIVRMAETRAKARALRDAINVGAAAFEELGGEEPEPATPSQVLRLRELAEQAGVDLEPIEAERGPIETLDAGTVETWIAALEERVEQMYDDVGEHGR